MINTKMLKRSIIMLISLFLIAIIIISSLFNLQILGYDDYQNDVLDQLMVETNVNPSRGDILDRNGKLIATNQTTWILYAMPKKVDDPEFIASEISKILDLNYLTLLEKIKNKAYKYQVISKTLNSEQMKEIREFINDNSLSDQLELNASTKRYYPYETLASHTLGFVNSDGVGIYGLEKIYNNVLEGTKGKYITSQDAQSGDMPFQYKDYIEPENSYGVVTTIDLYIQRQLEAQLEQAAIESGAQNRAAGIAIDPQTGEVLAMAVYPNFDLNAPYTLDEASQKVLDSYTKGTKEYNNEYLNLLFKMWNNKTVSELYEPGSTFKLVTTSVALQENVAKTTDLFNCSGALKIDGFYRAISCHKRTGHGTLTFKEALQQSCNPSMMNLAFRIGNDRFYEYFVKFGYTQKTGIDLPSESLGFYHSKSEFSNVSLAVYSFGQTFKTTAIQQLRMVSAVANGGYLVQPYLMKEIIDEKGNTVYENTIKKEKILDSSVCETISEILKEGVDGNGGAKNAYVAGYDVAAKTGTSEKKDKYDSSGNTSYRVSSCVAYAPSDNPSIAVIMIVDEPSVGSAYGSVVVAPYISKFLELVLPYLGVEADYSDKDSEYEKITIPSFVGENIEDVASKLTDNEILYEIIGSGDTVLKQVPKSNSEIYKIGGKIILYTSETLDDFQKVPDVTGKTAEEANLILTNAGFNVIFNGPTNFQKGSKAKVISQHPIADSIIYMGDVVELNILYTEEKD